MILSISLRDDSPWNSLRHEEEVDLIKVDVEGAEWQVLRGAEPIIRKIKSWLVEIHFRNDLEMKEVTQKMEAWLIQRGYKTQWIDDKHIYARK